MERGGRKKEPCPKVISDPPSSTQKGTWECHGLLIHMVGMVKLAVVRMRSLFCPTALTFTYLLSKTHRMGGGTGVCNGAFSSGTGLEKCLWVGMGRKQSSVMIHVTAGEVRMGVSRVQERCGKKLVGFGL